MTDNLPGHSVTVADYNRRCRMVKDMTLEQLDLMSKKGRKRFFEKTINKYTEAELLMALVQKGVALTEEQTKLITEAE